MARQCVEASRRVIGGLAPFDDFEQSGLVLEDAALQRVHVTPLPQQQSGMPSAHPSPF